MSDVYTNIRLTVVEVSPGTWRISVNGSFEHGRLCAKYFNTKHAAERYISRVLRDAKRSA